MSGARKDTTPITSENPNYVGRAAELGDFTVTFETLRGGGDQAPFFKGLPDDRCPCPHWGLVVSGRLTVRYRDREETFESGDAFYLPPGHLPVAAPGTELITFSPTVQLKEVNAVLARNLRELRS
jgi:glyoxylate utilization-related uncharacterized protein